MIFSELWLREWVNPKNSTDELAAQITMAGLEVDDIESVAGDFTGVVVGEVIECGQHPDADKLQVTKVDVGGEELLDIVCGAPNCCKGLKVAVATVGAVLPGNFKIKKAKLRGQASHGMLCSFSELGIDVESNGILELPENAAIGRDFREYLDLDDKSIDVDLTANRADCLSIRGLAREVSVLNNMPIVEPTFDPVVPALGSTFPVEIQAPDACPRYLSRIVKGVNVKAQTPLWMQEKLRRCGIRSIDPVVDVTNYVLLEQGQPMHAFDLDKLDTGIVVRLAQKGEKLVTLDGNELKLMDNTLIIADASGPIAIAGIFGGAGTGVNQETQNVLLESAFFAPSAIRGRAREYGLHTDASHRYERGVDFEMQHTAMERATELLLSICGGEAGPVKENVSQQHIAKAETIYVRRQKLDALLGHVVTDSEVMQILTALGCNVQVVEGGWNAITPSWRFDLSIEVNLIGEIGRIYGYNNIPNQAPVANLSMNPHQEKQQADKRVRDLLVDRGFHEAITYSFVDPELQKAVVPEIEPIVLPYPISQDMSAMRLSLITGLLTTVAYNQKRQQSRVRLFERGLRFVPKQAAENGVQQDVMLAGVIAGTAAEDHWSIESKGVDFFDLKGDLEAILELCVDANAFSFRTGKHAAMHPGQTAEIFKDNKSVGFIGTVHPELERVFGLNGKAIVFEIEWDAIATRQIPEAVAVSKFPANRRDIAVIVDEALESDSIVSTCLQSGGELVTSVNLFDVYQGQGVEDGKKSLAIALNLQSDERTLEDADIAQVVDNVVKALGEQFEATLRD